MTKSCPPPVARAFTLIEMLVVMAIIIGLAAILIPSLNSALESAKATKDLSNLRQIGTLMQAYLNDKDGILPVINAAPGIGTNASPVIYPKYVGSRRVFQSPFDKRPSLETDLAPVSYSINTNMYAKLGANPNMLNIVSPAANFFMAPTYTDGATRTWAGTATSAPDLPVGGTGETTGTHRSGKTINVLFCDWHTEGVTFGPSSILGSFQDFQSDPLGQKHWDPTK